MACRCSTHICRYAAHIYLNITHIHIHIYLYIILKEIEANGMKKKGKIYPNTRSNTITMNEHNICFEMLGNISVGEKENYCLHNFYYHKTLSLQVSQEGSS